MSELLKTVAMTASILAIVFTLITNFRLAWMIRKKVRRNHFKNKFWHPILATLAAVFFVEGLVLGADVVHQIVHSFDYGTVHWWFAMAYIPRAMVTMIFLFVIRAYSGAFELETKEV